MYMAVPLNLSLTPSPYSQIIAPELRSGVIRRPHVDVGRVKCPLEVVRGEWILIMGDGPLIALGKPVELRGGVIELASEVTWRGRYSDQRGKWMCSAFSW